MTYFWCLSLHYMLTHTMSLSQPLTWLPVKLLKIFPIQKSSTVINVPHSHCTDVTRFFSNAISSLSWRIACFKPAHQLCLPVSKLEKLIVESACIWFICFQWLKTYAAWCSSHIRSILQFFNKVKKKYKNIELGDSSIGLMHKMDVFRALV